MLATPYFSRRSSPISRSPVSKTVKEIRYTWCSEMAW